MMREILFKAKTIDNVEWIEGSLLKDEYGNCYMGTYIEPNCSKFVIDGSRGGKTLKRFVGVGFVLVNPNTICQCTGLTDKNGKKIWENDIVRKKDTTPLGWARTRNCKVNFNKFGYWMITTELGDGYWIGEFCEEQLEVVGNVFDNPELMEVE